MRKVAVKKPLETDLPSLMALVAMNLAIAIYAVAMFLFVPRTSDVDELGLFNPIYMKLTTGHMTYPVYGYFDSMFVHPPVRYLEIAYLMKAGLTFPYAEGFVVFLLTIAISAAILLGKFDPLSKLSLTFGFSSALLYISTVYDKTYNVRPDTQLALAWLLALILLQDGLNRQWNIPRFFLGAFLITYASGLHYFGICGFLGLLYYFVRAWTNLPRAWFLKVSGAMVAGACLFGFPYIFLFVLPDWRGIINISHAVQAQGSFWSPIQRHFQQYSFWLLSSRPLRLWPLIYPFLSLKIPLFAAGATILALKKDVRGIALGSVPLTAFVFFYSQGKSDGYYLPELMIFFCGLGLFASWSLAFVFSRLLRRPSAWITSVCFLMFFGWATELGYPEYAQAKVSSAPLVAPMDIARACARQMVGNNAFIAGRIGLWYISGAQGWFDPAPDVLWQHDISQIDLHDYFSQFDYVVEHDHMSNVTVNARQESLPSWYVSGLLKLRGFFLSDLHDNMNFLLFSTTPSAAMTGYIFERNKVLRFDEEPAGRSVFLSRLCGFESWPPVNRFHLPRFSAIYLPKASRDGSTSMLPQARRGDPQAAVVSSVVTSEEFATLKPQLDTECTELETRYGSLAEQDISQLLNKWRRTEHPMTFYRSVDAAIAPRFAPNTLVLPSFDVNHFQVASASANLSGKLMKAVVTPKAAYSYAAIMPIPSATLPDPSWVAIKGKVVKGQVGLAVLDTGKNSFISRQFVDPDNGTQTYYLSVGPENVPKSLIVENGVYGGTSEIQIENVHIICGGKASGKPAMPPNGR